MIELNFLKHVYYDLPLFISVAWHGQFDLRIP